MVDEVEIKITADASEAKQAFRDIHFYEKALQEDTKLLKDLQVEYKESLAQTGGKLLGKTLELHKRILDVKASIAKSEREIEKSGKVQNKNLSKMMKGVGRTFGGKLATLGVVGSIAGVVYALKNIASKGALETRSQYLSSISTGMAGADYSRVVGGASASGVSSGNLTSVLSNINNGLLAFKTGLGDVNSLVDVLNRTRISITDEKGRLKTQKKLLEEIQDWVKTQDKATALFKLSPLGFTPDLINEMHDGNIFSERGLGLTEDQIKANNYLARSMADLNESTKQLRGVLSSSIAPVLSEATKGLSDILKEISGGITEAQNRNRKVSRATFGVEVEGQRLKAIRGLSEADKEKYIKNVMNKTKDELTAEEFLLIFGSDKQFSNAQFLRSAIAAQKALIKNGSGSKELLDFYEEAYTRMLIPYKANREYTPVHGIAKNVPFDSKGRKWEVLNLSKIPDKVQSASNGGGYTVAQQNAEIELNFYGDVSPEQVKESAMEGVINAFQETVQQSVGG